MKRVGITRERVLPVLDQLGVRSLARRIVPDRVTSRVPDSQGRVKRGVKGELIDWEESTAVASGQGPVYVLADPVSEWRAIRDELLDKLDALQDPTETPVVEAAKPAEAVYEGPYTHEGPDILLDQAPHIYINGNLGSDQVFVDPDTWAGENKDTGLFIAYGPNVDPDGAVDEMKITDIAPTLLTLHQASIPEEMDGDVLFDIFESGDSDEETERVPIETLVEEGKNVQRGDEEEIQQRLEDLGYI